MSSWENYLQKEKIAQEQGYAENLDLLHNAQREFVDLGLFEESFLHDIQYSFLGDFKKEEDGYKNLMLQEDNSFIPIIPEQEDMAQNIYCFSRPYSPLEKFFFRDKRYSHKCASMV